MVVAVPDRPTYTVHEEAFEEPHVIVYDCVGVVVLKRLADALRDGDTLRGIILGSAVTQDGRTNGITAPNGPAQTALITSLYRRVSIDPDSIGLIEAGKTLLATRTSGSPTAYVNAIWI